MDDNNGVQVTSINIYARAFVPHKLKAVNAAPASVIPSLPARWVDFAQYVGSFAGTSLLLADPAPPDLDGEQAQQGSNGSLEVNKLELISYFSYFQHALIQEATAQQLECEGNALYKVPVVRPLRDSRPDIFLLRVPGLRELSLRIEIGDVVQLRQLEFDVRGEIMQTWFRHDATVWNIDRTKETLTLCVNGLALRSMVFNVCFTVQAGRIGALYRSVMSTQKALRAGGESWMRSMLFPRESDGVWQTKLNKGSSNLKLPQLNYEQNKAVETVLANDYGQVPYLISGPPGTGKTKTLVELAMQMLSNSQAAHHLIVCAPSDAAADTLVLRLAKSLQPPELLRLNAPSRGFPEVPGSILPYCYVDSDMFSLPPFQHLMRCKIVVTTCRDAELMTRARVTNADLHFLEHGMIRTLHPDDAVAHPRLHWTALLLDEAAQATEPEALIALSVVAPPSGYEATQQCIPLFVMAGDQHQLGPWTASPAIRKSLFARLLEQPLYADHPLARSKQRGGVVRPLTQDMLPIRRPPFTNLNRNYRSHPSILATPSVLFYNDTLEPEAACVDSLLTWPGWRGRKWPCLFVDHAGRDEFELGGGGWYNNSEAELACRLAKSFTGLCQPSEIAIQSPFPNQVKCLRLWARHPSYNIPGVNIGPSAALQGLEFKLVIICTTRTRGGAFIEQDISRGLGLIHEPQKTNVALTRAMEGLIVIGDSATLSKDENWAAFLAFCHRNGLWEGDDTGVKFEAAGEVSRLERNLISRDDIKLGSMKGALEGQRTLGSRQTEADEAWQSGVAAEYALLELHEAEGATGSSGSR